MNKAARVKDWLQMYKSLSDPDTIEKNKRLERNKKLKEAKRKDVGL